MIARRWTGLSLLIMAWGAVALIGPTGCGSDSNEVSAASLQPRLFPVSFAPGFHQLRTFDWSDPVNLVGEGLFLPEATHPSEAVKKIRSEGFKGATGEELNRGGPEGDHIGTGVMKFESDSGAEKVRDWLHGKDLQQPCFVQCIYNPRNLAIAGIPGVKAVEQVPNAAANKPPPGVKLPPGAKIPAGAGPPTHYFMGYPIGPYVYFASTEGSAGTKARFVKATQRYYNRVKGLSSS